LAGEDLARDDDPPQSFADDVNMNLCCAAVQRADDAMVSRDSAAHGGGRENDRARRDRRLDER
jgi:hypothetical protein